MKRGYEFYPGATKNPEGVFVLPTQYGQAMAVKRGIALDRHVRSAHGGEVSQVCPACEELQRKQKEMEER